MSIRKFKGKLHQLQTFPMTKFRHFSITDHFNERRRGKGNLKTNHQTDRKQHHQ